MSSINFRIYGDQIYGLGISKIKDIITPEIEKESFLKMFKEGQIKYENIQNKEKIQINPQASINNLQITTLILNIPNETGNFGMNISGIKTELELFDICETDFEKTLISKRQSLIEKFIKFAVKEIENKESSKSMIEGLIENLLNRALNGLTIELSNIEIKVKYKNLFFILVLESISYSEENGICIKNLGINWEDEEIKDEKNSIIKQFDIKVQIKKSEDEGGFNQVDIFISDFQFELKKSTILAFNKIHGLFQDVRYKYIYIRYKKLQIGRAHV